MPPSSSLQVNKKKMKKMWKSIEKKQIKRKNYPFASLGVGIDDWESGAGSNDDARNRIKMIFEVFRGYKFQSR